MQADKQTDRLFVIFETIIRKGPMTLTQLVAETGIPRSAIHRTAQMLQAHGWVRARLSDHAYEASARFDIMMGDGHFAHPAAEAHTDLLIHAAEKDLHADLAAFIGRGQLAIVESTRRRCALGEPVSLAANPLGLVALRQLSPVARVRHLDAYLPNASEAERQRITSGEVARHLAAASAETPVATAGALTLPLTDGEEEGLTLNLTPKGAEGRAFLDTLLQDARSSLKILQELAPKGRKTG